MTGTSLVRADDLMPATTLEVWREAAELAKAIARTEFVPKAFLNRPEAVTAAILTGHEIGIGPMQALSKIHVIEGRPAMSGELMRALVLSKGHELWVEENSNTRVVLCGRRKESDHVSRVAWTMDDAKRARLEAKNTWRAYPRAMLLARATGELCRMVFADVLGGISYTPEELDDGVIDVVPADAPGDEADAPKPITRQAAPAKKAAAKKQAAPARPAAPVEPPAPPLPGEDGFDGDPPASERPSAEASDDESKRRAQQIAMKCQQAGLSDDDRHHLIAAVTNGVKSSAKTVTADEGSDVLLAVHELAAGRKALVEVDDSWQLVEVEDATEDQRAEADPGVDERREDPPPLEEETWDGVQWRDYLRPRGIKVSEVIKEAQRLAGELEISPPTTLDQLKGNRNLASLVRGYVEDEAEKRGYRP